MTNVQIIATLIFALTFALILSERVHRTIAGMMGATVMLVVGMLLGFYDQHEALASIDFNTLGLLLGMMILVRLLEQTGVFQYLAILVGKRSRGNPWLLMVTLGTATAVISMFLDNVTTVVLIVPVTILISQILGISPIPLLMAEALLSNVGGVATLIGDPPNILIGSASGLSFTEFITHLLPMAFGAWLATLVVFRLVFRRELAQRPKDIHALMQLNEREALHDPVTLRKVLIVLAGVILFFFLHSALELKPATIALSGAAVALLWVRPNVDDTLKHVEWSVLLFFAALFVATGGLEATGVLKLVADGVASLASSNLLVACLALLWVSALLSAVVDNIPFAIVMIPIILELGNAGIPMSPLWWALALGVGLGGNGSPIGATANVITVSYSARTHTPITTRIWLRSGLPAMLATCAVVSVLFALFFGWMQTP